MGLNIIYENTDITKYVNVTKCLCRDVSCGRADSVEIEFDHAAVWHSWNPQEDDTITVILDGYSTGKMYVSAIVPEGDKFRILATALPSAARRKAWAVYRDMTLGEIMHNSAVEIGMDAVLYGISDNIKYSCIMRENEGCAAFLNNLGKCEGVALKACNGRFRGIYIPYAQGLDAVQKLHIDTTQDGVIYTRQENKKISTLTVLSPYARVNATDTAATKGSAATITTLPAMNAVQAGRWARGILLSINRQAERLTVKSTFNPTMAAMVRVDVEGTGKMAGAWIVDEVEHDLVNLKTEIAALRVITTVQ